ncbi:AarF/ABC1/UbiB kinase family protein [Nocardia sp. NPDC005978]|uniref:ABC1 kinase family protein n=1 Tax=Nocardia sp. NPDC005978 TaxID=3156725 RepID=UPI0033A320B2
MSVRRTGGRRGNGDLAGNPPTRTAVRSAKLAALPLAFAGRRAAGAGKKALGRSRTEVDREIRLRTAQHLFEVLGELKGFAAKIGQVLAVYELALPLELAEPYRIALSRLHDSTPAMLPSTVHAVLTESFGPDWRVNFREFDDRRAASATIGQVHRAIWHDGRPVAVKLMYPGAREAVHSDLEHLRRMSALLAVFVPNADIRAMTERLAECIRAELDFAQEAENQRAFALAFDGDPDFRVARVVARRGDVIVSEWLDGVPLTRLIDMGAQAERDRVGLLAIRFVLSSPERTGLLYGDPHPGNFRVQPDGRLGVVDFGACTPWPPPQFAPMVFEVGDALINGGPAELDAAIRRHGFARRDSVFDAVALGDQLRAYAELLLRERARVDREWLRARVLVALNPRLDNVNRHLDLPAYYVPFGRAVTTLFGLVSQLGASGPIRDEVLRWSPELTEVMARHRARTGGPTDLAAVRLRRSTIGDSRRRA